MSEKILGTCEVPRRSHYNCPDISNPHIETSMCEGWQPVASPQATRPDAVRVYAEQPGHFKTTVGRMFKYPNSVTEVSQSDGNVQAAQPAAGTTPNVPERLWCSYPDCPCDREYGGVCQYKRSANSNFGKVVDATTPQAERPKFEKWADTSKILRTQADKFRRDDLFPDKYFWGIMQSAWEAWQYRARAVAPVETREFTEIKPVGSHIIDHPDLKRWLEQEPRYAEQRSDGLWIHYTAICTLLKSYAAQKVAPAQTRLTAEQFWSDYWKTVWDCAPTELEPDDACMFAEAFRDKSDELKKPERYFLLRYETEAAISAGLREEIERLTDERHQYAMSISAALGGDITKTTFERITELRAKLAEQERENKFLNERVVGWREQFKQEFELREAAEAEVAALRERERWIPVEEKEPPKDGSEVLLKVKYRAGIPEGKLVGHWQRGGHCIEDHPPIEAGWYFWNGIMFDLASEPTHWKALSPGPVLPTDLQPKEKQ